MSKRDKLRRKLRNNPGGVRFTDLETLLLRFGFMLARIKGSHFFQFQQGDTKLIMVVPVHGNSVKSQYVKDTIDLLDEFSQKRHKRLMIWRMTMATARKPLEYYLSLPYTIEIIPDTQDGGYVARVKELRGCMTQADNWEELIRMIEQAKEGWLEVALEQGHPIPEPAGAFPNS